VTLVLAVTLVAASVTLGTAAQASTASTPLSRLTGVGVHNTYDPASFGYLANGLDSGTSLVELDVWADALLHRWHVSHDDPVGSLNNCAAATRAAQLYTGSRNHDLPICLDDLRIWSAAHPGHRPIVVKLELKDGFEATKGLSATALDTVISRALGAAVFRPADLLAKPGGGSYPTLDAAARADNWPTRGGLAGKFIFEIIPGTVEEANPLDHLGTDLEYGRHLRDLAAAGRLDTAQIFPAVHGAQPGDPRTRYAEGTVRPWFVFFDGDATSYLSSIGTAWYDSRHYFLIMTDAQNVPPALSDTAPSRADARARVARLAADHASIVSTDWARLPSVLAEEVHRG
jgi:hypothetical protein